ncbi:hypothetical protein TNCV_5108491 [Trichonephila clavipes]|nr:hypothetical protein TNCV_5108491 [Trichonephila clavipes]
MRTKNLHSGVPPPITESNKGGSVPVIWQNQARRLPEVHPEYNATASGQDPTVKWVCGLDRKKKKREIWMARKRAENREGSLGFPGFVKPVFTKDSKPLGRRKRSLGHLGSVKPVLT